MISCLIIQQLRHTHTHTHTYIHTHTRRTEYLSPSFISSFTPIPPLFLYSYTKKKRIEKSAASSNPITLFKLSSSNKSLFFFPPCFTHCLTTSQKYTNISYEMYEYRKTILNPSQFMKFNLFPPTREQKMATILRQIK